MLLDALQYSRSDWPRYGAGWTIGGAVRHCVGVQVQVQLDATQAAQSPDPCSHTALRLLTWVWSRPMPRGQSATLRVHASLRCCCGHGARGTSMCVAQAAVARELSKARLRATHSEVCTPEGKVDSGDLGRAWVEWVPQSCAG